LIFGGIGLIDGYFQGQFGGGAWNPWAGGAWGKPVMGGPPPFVQTLQPGIQQVADRIEMANLPVELQDSADQVLLDAAKGFETCDEAYQTSMIYWQYKVCNAMQLRKATMAVKALEKQATLITTTPAGVVASA
jgi:hypothetical protein